jgi:uncharacterized protein YegL
VPRPKNRDTRRLPKPMATDLLEQAEFADNPEPRCPVVLLLDTSGSMHGEPIAELNSGVKELENDLKGDPLASLRVEIAIVTFGGDVAALDVRSGDGTVPFDASQAFVTVDQFSPPTLTAGGETPMGEAVQRALVLIRERKDVYKQNDIDYYRPWLFLITDGEPTDLTWEAAADQARQEEDRKGVMVFPVGVQGANLTKLGRFSSRQPILLNGLDFRELFKWVSNSLAAVGHSRPGEQVPLAPVNWGTVES